MFMDSDLNMQNIGLLSLSDNEQKLLDGFLKLPFTHSEQKEVLKYIEEICIKNKIAPDKLFDHLKINELLDNKEVPGKELVKQARNILHKTRFPLLTKREAEFAEWKKQIKISPEISLNHAPNFEQEWLEVRFRFSNLDQLIERINSLNKIKAVWENNGL
ncbi:MAG: hypothetical protein ABIH39_04780 [Candidatus Margulisiibacteriota bacterium]